MEKFKSFLKNGKNLMMLIAILVVIVAVVLLIVVIFNKVTFSNSSDGEIFKYEYEKLNNVVTDDDKKYPRVSVSSDNIIKYVSYDEVIEVFNNGGDEVIYFGYPTCLYCRTAVQVLLNVAKDTELDEIYYLDVEEKGNKYDELLDVLGDNFVVTEDGKKEIYSPLVIFVTDGRIVSYNKGTLFSQEDPYTELDQSQIDGLGQIYGHGINDVLASKKIKK